MVKDSRFIDERSGRAERNVKGSSMDVVERLREFSESEARSVSMDFGCITPLYVYRMWGGKVPLHEIEEALKELRKQ